MNATQRKEAAAGDSQALDHLQAFFVRFKARKQRETQACDSIRQFLRRFRDAEPDLRRRESEWEKVAVPRFNLFRVLRIQRRETKLHSRFLAELLNPRGSHGQGDLFLRGFVEMVEIARGQDLIPQTASWDLSKWEVTPEKAIDSGGRLDLLLTGQVSPGSRQFMAVIENKVDARERTDQCSEYRDWLNKQPECEVRRAIFLTPDGHAPETDPSGDWIYLSYRQHIKNWLEETIGNSRIHAPHLRLAIEQYLQIVKSL